MNKDPKLVKEILAVYMKLKLEINSVIDPSKFTTKTQSSLCGKFWLFLIEWQIPAPGAYLIKPDKHGFEIDRHPIKFFDQILAYIAEKIIIILIFSLNNCIESRNYRWLLTFVLNVTRYPFLVRFAAGAPNGEIIFFICRVEIFFMFDKITLIQRG
jgi:hypothetical protein